MTKKLKLVYMKFNRNFENQSDILSNTASKVLLGIIIAPLIGIWFAPTYEHKSDTASSQHQLEQLKNSAPKNFHQ
jgi:hypothetical protein